jgi:hypothetical protein
MAVYKLTVCLAHTMGTYLPCSLYTHLEYNDMAHDIATRKQKIMPLPGPYPMPRPLTRDAGPTPLHALLGGEWKQSVGSCFRDGMALIRGIRALVASQHSGSIE